MMFSQYWKFLKILLFFSKTKLNWTFEKKKNDKKVHFKKKKLFCPSTVSTLIYSFSAVFSSIMAIACMV